VQSIRIAILRLNLQFKVLSGSTICDDGNSCTGGDHGSGQAILCGRNLRMELQSDEVCCVYSRKQCTSAVGAPTVLIIHYAPRTWEFRGNVYLIGCVATGCPVCMTSQKTFGLASPSEQWERFR
jgi:hypothetical protein